MVERRALAFTLLGAAVFVAYLVYTNPFAVLTGVPLSAAAAISLLTRLATYWFEVLVCVPVALKFGYKEFLSKYFAR